MRTSVRATTRPCVAGRIRPLIGFHLRRLAHQSVHRRSARAIGREVLWPSGRASVKRYEHCTRLLLDEYCASGKVRRKGTTDCQRSRV